jgi:EAL domain-containing protein (putative c-di-GMP-specific phosphodiesterase class I)
VTESVLMSTVESAELDRVSAAGFAVAIDDFGTGYSSLSYLTRHRVDVLKIDRSFVDRFAREDASTAVVRAVIDLARTLRARSVAEGVETVDQHAALVPLGCDALAGDLLARPAGAGDAARYLVAAR